MYFVDRGRIEKILVHFEEQYALFLHHEKWESELELRALERIGQLLIEGILDVGNDMIDGFIMRDPGSYNDIVDILHDEKVITSEDEGLLKDFIRYRKELVQQYIDINHEELIEALKRNAPVLEAFPTRIRTYLENELGPVSAFKN
ncbi:DUF86 domain-containing protein [Priestia endophytica]|uniref:DUF86 domain-containing protein n=1 Tax=Priestia endophytica TaxID=135735 RepID=UPI000DCA7F49|nr:DUF86 domain-containing protein [Priestia endophytica]RAS87495.1 hypothetical protein A4U60_05370 [Priestia endophytica]